MARTRSIPYVNDVGGVTISLLYTKWNPQTGLPFDSASITGVTFAAYDRSDGSSLLASIAGTYDAALGGYRYNWAYAGPVRSIRVVATPTIAGGVSPKLVRVEHEDLDMSDILARLGKNTEAATDPSAASGTLFSKARGTGVDTDALMTEVVAIEGTGWNAATDNLHQAKLARDSIMTQISALDLRQSTSLLLPPFMVQGKTYTVYLRVKDDNGAAVDADALPTLTLLEGAITGVTLSAFTRDSLGNYHATIAIGGAVPVDTTLSPRAAWNRTEGGIVNAEEAVRYVVVDSFESDSAAILANTNTILGHLTNVTYGLPALQVIVADIQAKVNNGTYGLAALRADIDAVAAQVGTDAGATLQQKLGAFTSVLNLFQMVGAFTPSDDLRNAILYVQGMLPT